MTRPTYESEADLETEKKVASMLEMIWDVDVTKLAQRDSFDFQLRERKEPNRVFYLELKDRRPNYSTERMRVLGSYMISQRKFMAGVNGDHQYGIMIILSDAVYWWSGYPGIDYHYAVMNGGRHDRGDPADVEPCVYIPFNDFRRVA